MRVLHENRRRGMHRGWCILGLLTVPLLSGCGGGGGGSNGNSGGGTTTTGTNTGTPTVLSVSAITATGLTATLSENVGTIGVGGTVTYTMTLANNTAANIPVLATAVPPTTPSAVVKVIGPTGAVTFQPIPMGPPLDNGTLLAGQSISTTQVATGFTTVGMYSATATFSDDTVAAKAVGPLTVTAQ